MIELLEAALGARGAMISVVRTKAELRSILEPSSAPSFDGVLVDLSPIADELHESLVRLGAAAPGAPVVLITGTAGELPVEPDGARLRLVRKPFEVREVVDALVDPVLEEPGNGSPLGP